MVSDLGTLRTLLVSLTQYDCVTFNCVASSLRTTEQALRSAGWMLLDAAETLFVTAKARVYGAKAKDYVNDPPTLLLEQNPKWTALLEVVKEIRLELEKEENDPLLPTTKTLIVAEDDRTCHQLRSILETGTTEFLLKLHQKALAAQEDKEKK